MIGAVEGALRDVDILLCASIRCRGPRGLRRAGARVSRRAALGLACRRRARHRCRLPVTVPARPPGTLAGRGTDSASPDQGIRLSQEPAGFNDGPQPVADLRRPANWIHDLARHPIPPNQVAAGRLVCQAAIVRCDRDDLGGRGAKALPASLERMRRKLQGSDDGDRQIVKVLSAVLTDGLAAVEAARAEAFADGVHSADVIPNILSRQRYPGPRILAMIIEQKAPESQVRSGSLTSYERRLINICSAQESLSIP
jgi:hypothetical protein